MSIPKPTALLDLDGTLVDSAPDLAAAAAQWLADIGRPPLPPAKIVSFVGDGASMLVDRCLEATGGPTARDRATETAAFLAAYADRHNRATRPYPGVEAALTRLAEAGWGLAVVTNKPEAAARAVVADTGLDRWLSVVVGGDTLATRKPDPAPLIEACAQLDRPLAGAVMVGDGPQDARAAKAAGIPAIHVPFGYGDGATARGLADAVAADWDGVVAALIRLGGGR